MACTVAARQFFDLGPGLGLVGLELLNRWVAQDSRDTRHALPTTAAHGLHLAVLAFGFGTLAARIDHAVAGEGQFGRADGGHALHVYQILRFAERLQAVFRFLQLGTQFAQAVVHPIGRRHGHFHARFQLAFNEPLGHCVGGHGGHARIRHVHLHFDELALALRYNADAFHEVLGDRIQDLRFGGVALFFQVIGQRHGYDLAQILA
ncbi:hypothetical protein D9M69_571830 [compost metagenome]